MRVQDGAPASAPARDANGRTARRRVGPPLRRPLLGVARARIRAGGCRTHAGRAAGPARVDPDPGAWSRGLGARVHRRLPGRARDRRRAGTRPDRVRRGPRRVPAADPAARARPARVRHRHPRVVRLRRPRSAGRARRGAGPPCRAQTRDAACACGLRPHVRVARDPRDHHVPDRAGPLLPLAGRRRPGSSRGRLPGPARSLPALPPRRCTALRRSGRPGRRLGPPTEEERCRPTSCSRA